ncbi:MULTISPECIES: hypothetical protein [unclassified Streptomyces]|uniref:hypothetical protein n=1 Tax=unclassified Streptomyces TaxID=2593676 RepID=UPI002DDC24F1|nr:MULTISPECIES: hypothetical protein [unclassified Streptomyces]WSF81757.1 hypothetical protein OIE70_00175 [Streptomyces sp. NBC_01744]WSC34124.1 hypothetical protein OHA08_00165 [Streptomyces sp. NBC_01763]WSC41934.1 hypothetical protein OHA08_44815 [Streptomyces sp. NBC_01763]WSC50922.1 hypothetical protein OG808_00165 [Streptomyces sp. NBC_01761]WSC58599.1 hypothetical protein OG808_44150 [Streptomyces sp. NBC_01761]
MINTNKLTRGRWSPVRTRPGIELATHYDDPTVVKMGARDSVVAAGGSRWGPNKVLWGLLAVLQTVVPHTAAIRIRLEERLVPIWARYEKAKARFDSVFNGAGSAITTVAQELAERRALHQTIADHGLRRPGSRWPAICFLTLIVVGDLALTSIAMAVLGVSDRRFVSWMPFSELQVAAAPVVTGMVAAAHVLGEAIREHRDADQRIKSHVKVITGAGLGGALMLALAVAAIRSAFLRANGIQAMTLWFIALQLGLFLVATAISVHSAHPFGEPYRQQQRQLRRAERHFYRERKRAGHYAAQVNAIVAAHRGTVTAARGGIEAVAGNAARAGYLYLREIMHGLPEPTADPVLDGDLPQIEVPSSARELLEYPAVAADSTLTAPAPVSCHDLDRRWAALQSGPVAPLTGLHVVHEDEYVEEDA